MIRGELDSTFMETKRNKPLWEVVSAKMKERGYNRSVEQCKSKWKNILTRYKGYETIEEEGMRQQFPFYKELQAIFTNRMQRILWMEAEGIPSESNKRGMWFLSDEEDENEDRLVEKANYSGKKKQKAIESSTSSRGNSDNTNNGTINNLKEVLEEYMKRQMDIEMQWMKRYDAKEEERRMKEMEWRQTMETLEKERIMLDKQWREREEQRRKREEARIEKRDSLITTLLEKLRSQGL
ncbi:hypothetical protein Ccrd_018376 [Cynara cardunculus var. scolymus]|uniref:Myb/SANT-like DNA-binding domain-containing protein n=2 Tax=Cynara cardunculus var. scolymus TaxID=59895 RepID=A0A103Y6B8_CYNCS|nr:hypothetical protein Ccrd_018376 [Cynara cardunculus var. scolymus]